MSGLSRSSVGIFALGLFVVGAAVLPVGVYAQSCSNSAAPGPFRTINTHVDAWQVSIASQHECGSGARVELTASRDFPAGSSRGGPNAHAPTGSSVLSMPIFCRRDDYMFLPPNALGGIPCLSVPSNQHFDARPLAVQMAAQVPPPDLRIGMNPQKGMVRVPTWFWVEGYDGGTIGAAQTVREDDTICHTVPLRGGDGLALLDTDGRPRTRQDCHTDTTIFNVEVRLFPTHYTWDFGDNHAKDIACSGIGDCANALGSPFVDPLHESPIQHPYVWSSLGVNGAADAYTIKLDINFAAQFRWSANGRDQGGWQSLPARALEWTAAHQVQEAQAVLVKACPVSVVSC